MTSSARKALCVLGALFFIPLLSRQAAAQQADTTLENAEAILTRAFSQVDDTPIAQTFDAGPVIASLRSSKDKDLLPLFERMRKSKSPENQVYGMVAAVVVTKDPHLLDVTLLLNSHDAGLIQSAIATLIDTDQISVEQLQQVVKDSPDVTLKVMCLGELSRRKELKDRKPLLDLLTSDKNMVRFYAAITILADSDTTDDAAALSALHDLSLDHDLRQAAIEAMMLVRVQKESIKRAVPWVDQIAADEAKDEGLRYTAVSTLLSLNHPDGPKILGSLIQSDHEIVQQVKLGLMAMEFASHLTPAMLDPIAHSRSSLVASIGTLAQEGAAGTDNTAGLLKLIKQGHPIVLDWALASYSDKVDKDRQLDLLAALVNQSTIVDETRGRDYERAAMAAEKMLEKCGKEGRVMIATLLKSGNRAVVEAVIAGIYRSDAADQSELILPVYSQLQTSSSLETSANYAALILAREGHKETIPWLAGMVLGSTAQNTGFRGLAGWYYAKLVGQEDAMIQHVLAKGG